MNTRDPLRPLSRVSMWIVVLLASLVFEGCGGGSGDDGTVDLTPQGAAGVKTGLTKEAEARARRIATEAGGKAR